jgi:hypothetical protein
MAVTMNTRRNEVLWASGLNMLVGMWLYISAFAVFAQGEMTASNMICGIAVVGLAAIHSIWAFDRAWMGWAISAIGVWTIVAPWALTSSMSGGPTLGIIISNSVTGGVIALLGCWSASAAGHGPREPFFSNPSRLPLGR